MAKPLFLTANEKKVLEKLPASVMKDWEVEEETGTFQDTPAKLDIRLRNLKVQHPGLKKIQEEAKTKKFTEKDIAEMANSVDLSGLSQDDLMELTFAWGPDVFTAMIAAALPSVETAEDLDAVGQFGLLRHGLFLAMNR